MMVFLMLWNPHAAPVNFEVKPFVESISDRDLYGALQLQSHGLEYQVFSAALKGYRHLVDQGTLRNPLLSIADFTLASKEERLWVIDMEKRELLYQTLVAHGRNSGEQYATSFSNDLNSNMSSLGFYLTGPSYQGKHGLSLRLEGLEKGINDHALVRNIVIHAAEYVSKTFIKNYGRLGRSLGCPALPKSVAGDIISLIAEGSCFFIYSSSSMYPQKSPILNIQS